MRITEATENYMEAILVLGEKGPVRSVDVANYLGFSKPTISQYMKQFVNKGLVKIDAEGHITLTDEGRQVAENTLERHRIISKLFMAMGVPEEIAVEDACKVEHDLSDITFECMKKHFLKYVLK